MIRLFIAFLALGALAALIWFGGPLVAIAGSVPLATEVSRLVAIIVVMMIWGSVNLIKLTRARKADNSLTAAVTEPPKEDEASPDEDPQSAQAGEEIEVLQRRFKEAVTVLKKSAAKKKRRYNLYELPLYIIIGPPGSGKTTALANSGLEFPLEEHYGRDGVRGVGGTRNCDWWFTEDAVLIDTAGRYLTQDSNQQDDSAAWGGFLKLLKKYRRRRPINGALLAVSVADLMTQDEAEREVHTRAMRKRLNELKEHLNIDFPVYVVVTKCDMIAGFMEFFDDFGREDRRQIWGMTFPPEERAEEGLRRFAAEFDFLAQRLDSRLMWSLNHERDLLRRGHIYAFPQQFNTLREPLERLLIDVFGPSRFDSGPQIRGVYFTSGTQQGTPIDKLMGNISKSFGIATHALPSFDGQGASYFILNLLKDVVFAESELVGANRGMEIARAWAQRLAYVGTVIVTLLAAMAWSTSYMRNQTYVTRMQENIVTYYDAAERQSGQKLTFASALPRLDALRAGTNVYQEFSDSVPWLMGLGLYQGSKLDPDAIGAYARELNRVLLPLIAQRLATQLRKGQNDPDFLFETLKNYLMLGNLERLIPEQIMVWATVDWQSTMSEDTKLQGHLVEHLESLIELGMEPIDLDQDLIKETRRILNRVPLAELLYGRFKRDARAADLGDFRLSDLLRNVPGESFVRKSGKSLDTPIPGLYTYAGFFQIYLKQSKSLIKQARDERWILQAEGEDFTALEMTKLEDDVRSLYLEDYIQHWDSMLTDLKLIQVRSIDDSIKLLKLLSDAGSGSPLRVLLRAVDHNTALNNLPPSLKVLADAAAKSRAGQGRMTRLLTSMIGASAEDKDPGLPGDAVDHHFARLNFVMRGDEKTMPPLIKLSELLAESYVYLGSLQNLSGEELAKMPKSDILQQLMIMSARQPQPLKGWLEQIIFSNRRVTNNKLKYEADKLEKKLAEEARLEEEKKALEESLLLENQKAALLATIVNEWGTKILPNCNNALANRYPLFKDGELEINLADFSRVFGPGGLLASFFDEHLSAYVDTTLSVWEWREANLISLGFSSTALSNFQLAARIRESFFSAEGPSMKIEFLLKPRSLDLGTVRFELNLDGQKFGYKHGPASFAQAVWPGPENPAGVQFFFLDSDNRRKTVRYEGPWAWFRILEKSLIKQEASDRMVVAFEAKGAVAEYEIRALSVVNPFNLEQLREFRCPQTL